MACRTSTIVKLNQLIRFYSSSHGGRENMIKRLEAKKKLFQLDDGVPVHLKGGFADIVLVRITGLLVGCGVIDALRTIYKLATKTK